MPRRTRTSRPKRMSKPVKVIYSVVGFFALGYFPTLILRIPQPAIVAAAAAIIPFGSKARGELRGFGRGLGLGLLSGLAIPIALIHRRALPPEQIDRITAIYALSTTLLCAAVATLFAHLGRRRARRMEQEWL